MLSLYIKSLIFPGNFVASSALPKYVSYIIVIISTADHCLVSAHLALFIKGLVVNLLLMSSQNYLSYLPTPPFGQDMTQGQFVSGV